MINVLLYSLTLLLAVPVCAGTRVRIATVPAEFTPYAGAGFPAPVSLSRYYFEVDRRTGRARVVVDYGYRDEAAFAGDDARRPDPTYAQIPGLAYDPSAHVVYYTRDDQKTICATVQESQTGLKVRATGNCTITTKYTEQGEDDGWTIRRVRMIEVYFEAK